MRTWVGEMRRRTPCRTVCRQPGDGRRPPHRWALRIAALLGGVLLLALGQSPVRAQQAGGEGAAVLVAPGDSLVSLAERYAVPVRTLMHLNGLRHPRDLVPGQRLVLGGAAPVPGRWHALAAGEDLMSLSLAAGWEVRALAQRNRLLLPTGLPTGARVWVPEGAVAVPVRGDTAAGRTSRLAAAVRSGARLWQVLAHNPVPSIAGAPVWVLGSRPAATQAPAASETVIPPLVRSLQLSPQPVARGETVAFTLETTEPVTCTFRAHDRVERCLALDGTGQRWAGMHALAAMLNPGPGTLTVVLERTGAAPVEVVLPLAVSKGRFDFERIDLPPDRQTLLDPARSQAENATIAGLRTLRSEARAWSYPFIRPIETHVTSYFGSRRSYGYGFGSYHAGTDFDGEVGMPVVAPAAGVVVLAEPLVVRGNAIMIDHGWGITSGFWHLSEIGVAVGQTVAAGEVVGALGNTGLSTGAHLHWELWVNGVAVNPLTWLEPDGPGGMVASQDGEGAP